MVALAILAATPAAAQTGWVRGVVFESGSHRPRAGVRIAVGEAVVLTNGDGGFRLVLPAGQHTLVVAGDLLPRVEVPDVPVIAGEVTEVIVTSGDVPVVRVESPGPRRAPTDLERLTAGPPVKLRGVVRKENGGPIRGARVLVRGIIEEAETGPDGRFELLVPEGTHDLTVIHAGHATVTTRDVVVTANAAAVEVAMVPVAVDLGVFTVTAPRVEGSALDLMAERRASKAVSDLIGAEQMSRSGDSDAASALRRVTGVTLVGGRFVYVRGLGERYASTLLNGAELPSPDPERRVVPLDLFPASVLESVVIQKTWSADRPGSFGGGSVQLRTRGYPAVLQAEVGLSVGVTLGETLTDGIRGPSGPTDFLGVDGGFRALPGSVRAASEVSPLLERDMFSTRGYTASQLEAFGEAMPRNWALGSAVIPPELGLSASVGDRFEVGDTRFGYLLGFTWDNDWDRTLEERSIFTVGGGRLELAHRYDFETVENEVTLSGLANLGVDIGDDHSLRLLSLVTRITSDEARRYEGYNRDVAGRIRVTRFRFVERMLVANQLLGSHALALPDGGPLTLDWRYTFAWADRIEPDRRQVRYDLEESTGQWFLSDRPESSQRVFSGLDDLSHDFGVDLAWPFAQWSGLESTLKAGATAVLKDRTVDTRRFRFLPKGPRATDPQVLLQAPEDIFTPENIGSDGFQFAEVTLPTDSYSASHHLVAAYASVDLPLTSALTLTAGVRVEHSSQVVDTFEPFNPEAAPVRAELTETDVLPALALTWELSEDMIVRTAVSRTVSRPDFRELSPATFNDVTGGRQIFGNPALERALLTHVDLRWEWYASAGESLSVGGFYKHFDSPIETVIVPSAQLSVTFENAPSAHVYGVEIEGRKDFAFIHPALRDLSLAVNGAWIGSRIELGDGPTIQTNRSRPLQGQSPFVVNVQLGWDDVDHGTHVSLLYNVFGRRIAEVGALGAPDSYEEPFHQLDLVLSQKLPHGLALGFKARNLLDLPVLRTQADETERRYHKGRSFSLSLSKSF